MKYFTAERYNAIQDDVPDTLDDWENQCRLYSGYLTKIRPELSESMRTFLTVCLHDADFDQWANLDPDAERVQLVIRQDDCGDDKFICVLRYKMLPPGYLTGDRLEAVSFVSHEGPGFCSKQSRWLYDEFEYVGTEDGILGERKVFRHSILLSNGELKITFSEFEFLLVPIGEGFIEAR